MTEYKLFDGSTPFVSTFEFHEHRERAPHLEQEGHRPRLLMAAEFVSDAIGMCRGDPSVSDLGCGDGGLLSIVQQWCPAWGYDFQPSNQPGWEQRGVQAKAVDVFNDPEALVEFGKITVTTEVLEHLANPHDTVRWIHGHTQFLVASSPWVENDIHHDPCHAWAWDQAGYRALIEDGGFTVRRHELVGGFQVIQGVA